MHKKNLEVKRYWSPDIENIWAWTPEENEVFYLLQMDIGLAEEAASDNYSIVIATPEGILANFSKKTSDEIYKIIIQKEYSWKMVMSHIRHLISTIDTWNKYEISDSLRDYFHWEYGRYNSLASR